MERVFREYGPPEVIRTDNGPSFASMGLGGLSALPVWWIKLGVILERIELCISILFFVVPAQAGAGTHKKPGALIRPPAKNGP